ncbi:MAG: hypothetical protein U0354_20620 [Candidatus Sericytochromatia bacterium]
MTLFIHLTEFRVKSFALTITFFIPLNEPQIIILNEVVLILVNVLKLEFTFHNRPVIRLFNFSIGVFNLAIVFHMITAYFTILVGFYELVPFPYKKHCFDYIPLLKSYHS